MTADIHNYRKRVESALRTLDGEKFAKVDKRRVRDFADYQLTVKKLSHGRVAKYIFCLIVVRRHLSCNFGDASRPQIEKAVAWVNGHGYTPKTRSDMLVLLRIFYRWLRSGNTDKKTPYPPEVAWIETGLKANEGTVPIFLTDAEVKRMVECAPSLRDRALFFLFVMFASVAGIAASPGNLPLVAVSAFAFMLAILGLVVTGLAYLVHAIQFGRREAYGAPAVTQLGEVVRSNSERVIADYLTGSGVKYLYEKPARTRWGLRRISRPDFYLPDYGVYIEYWGLVNLPNNSARGRYERSMRWKMDQYRRNGIRLVSLYPSDLHDLDAAFRPKLEQASGKAAPPPKGKGYLVHRNL